MQWLKCHRTQGNAVPLPLIFSPRRSLTSIFKRRRERQGERCGTLATGFQRAVHWIFASNTVLRFKILVEDVNVNAWLPDNEVNLVVSGPATTNRGTRGPKPSIRVPQPPTRGQNLKLQFPHLCISTLTTANMMMMIIYGRRRPWLQWRGIGLRKCTAQV